MKRRNSRGPRSKPFQAGSSAEAKWGSRWFRALVLSAPSDHKRLVRFLGWPGCDDRVPLRYLRPASSPVSQQQQQQQQEEATRQLARVGGDWKPIRPVNIDLSARTVLVEFPGAEEPDMWLSWEDVRGVPLGVPDGGGESNHDHGHRDEEAALDAEEDAMMMMAALEDEFALQSLEDAQTSSRSQSDAGSSPSKKSRGHLHPLSNTSPAVSSFHRPSSSSSHTVPSSSTDPTTTTITTTTTTTTTTTCSPTSTSPPCLQGMQWDAHSSPDNSRMSASLVSSPVSGAGGAGGAGGGGRCGDDGEATVAHHRMPSLPHPTTIPTIPSTTSSTSTLYTRQPQQHQPPTSSCQPMSLCSLGSPLPTSSSSSSTSASSSSSSPSSPSSSSLSPSTVASSPASGLFPLLPLAPCSPPKVKPDPCDSSQHLQQQEQPPSLPPAAAAAAASSSSSSSSQKQQMLIDVGDDPMVLDREETAGTSSPQMHSPMNMSAQPAKQLPEGMCMRVAVSDLHVNPSIILWAASNMSLVGRPVHEGSPPEWRACFRMESPNGRASPTHHPEAQLRVSLWGERFLRIAAAGSASRASVTALFSRIVQRAEYVQEERRREAELKQRAELERIAAEKAAAEAEARRVRKEEKRQRKEKLRRRKQDKALAAMMDLSPPSPPRLLPPPPPPPLPKPEVWPMPSATGAHPSQFMSRHPSIWGSHHLHGLYGQEGGEPIDPLTEVKPMAGGRCSDVFLLWERSGGRRPVAIKRQVVRDPEDEGDKVFRELAVMSHLSALLDSGKCFGFARAYSWLKCLPPITFPNPNLNIRFCNTQFVFICQEFAGEHNLSALLKSMRGGLPLDLLRSILFQVLFALAVSQQELGFVHHDLHFRNVVVQPLGSAECCVIGVGEQRFVLRGMRARIVDFALARIYVTGAQGAPDIFVGAGTVQGRFSVKEDIQKLGSEIARGRVLDRDSASPEELVLWDDLRKLLRAGTAAAVLVGHQLFHPLRDVSTEDMTVVAAAEVDEVHYPQLHEQLSTPRRRRPVSFACEGGRGVSLVSPNY